MSAASAASAASASSSSSSSTSSSSTDSLFLHKLEGKIKLVKRVIRGKGGAPDKTQHYLSNTEHNPQQNLVFMLGDADTGRLPKVIREPSQYQNNPQSAFTISLLLEKEDAAGARILWQTIIEGMKEHRLIDPSLHTGSESIMKMLFIPLIAEGSDGAVFMTVTLGDDVEYLLKISKGKYAGKFMRISRDQIRRGDRVVVVVRMDCHRDTPKHRFNRYAQRVFVLERSSPAGADASIMVGSSGNTVDVIDYDPSMEEEEEEVSATANPAAAAAAAAATGPSIASAAGATTAAEEGEGGAAEDDDGGDEFEQALKRARTAGAV
jgi:hypothetical protein